MPTVIVAEPKLIIFRACYVRIFPEQQYLETVYGDGLKAPAAPQNNERYRLQARNLGYAEDTWAMCREHEVLHTFLAEANGRIHSETLRGVARGQYAPFEVWTAEEAFVLAFQRFLNTGEWTDLVPRILNADELRRQARDLLAKVS